MGVHALLRECAADLLETESHVTVEQVVGCALTRHGEAFIEAQEEMVRGHAKAIVAKLMRDLSEQDQALFPGFGGLPSAIAVQTDTATYYVRSDKATWSELNTGRSLRVDNVVAAQLKLDAYDEAMSMLRPFMEGTDRTVAEAVRAMGRAA